MFAFTFVHRVYNTEVCSDVMLIAVMILMTKVYSDYDYGHFWVPGCFGVYVYCC